MSKYKLFKEIINLSNAQDWDTAKREWFLDIVYLSDESQTCLCGHFPIKEICIIKNLENNNSTVVGNCCVTKFFEIRTDMIFNSLKKIKTNIKNSVNKTFVEYAHKKRMLNNWEKNFYLDIWRKKFLSEKQWEKKISINKKLMYYFDKRLVRELNV